MDGDLHVQLHRGRGAPVLVVAGEVDLLTGDPWSSCELGSPEEPGVLARMTIATRSASG